MTKIQIPVDQMTHTIGVFKIGHGHLQQTLTRLNGQLTPYSAVLRARQPNALPTYTVMQRKT